MATGREVNVFVESDFMTRCAYLNSWFDSQSKKIDEEEKKTKKCFATGGKKE